MLLLHSQRRYIFEYDQTDRLLAVTMPSMVRHSLQSMLSVGYYRNIYSPPDSKASVIQDFARDGRLLQMLYLGTGRRVLYKYTKQARLSEIIYDTTLVTFTYDDSSGMIKTIHLMHEGFVCTIRYRQTGQYSFSVPVFDSPFCLFIFCVFFIHLFDMHVPTWSELFSYNHLAVFFIFML